MNLGLQIGREQVGRWSAVVMMIVPGCLSDGRPTRCRTVVTPPTIEMVVPVAYEPIDSTADTIDESASLDALVERAVEGNPLLRRLAHEVEAAWARVPQVRALPDPMLGARGLTEPMDEAAEIMATQTVPWLSRLDAQGRQASFEAQALEQTLAGGRLMVTAQVKAAYYTLYVLGQEIQINAANQEHLELLRQIVEARLRVAAPNARESDLSRALTETARLSQELLQLKQRRDSTRVRLNELLDRPAESPLPMPTQLGPEAPPWPLDLLLSQAKQYQPELLAAGLRSEAARLGVGVARLSRVPDVSLNLVRTYMHDGETAWSAGATINVPLWHNKYNALAVEASEKHQASIEDLRTLLRRYEALLADLLLQAQQAARTAEIYRTDVLPQARQTLEADQESYRQGSVEFDRVITDFRTLLELEVGYHRALGELGTTLAMIEQAVGTPPESVTVAGEPTSKSKRAQ